MSVYDYAARATGGTSARRHRAETAARMAEPFQPVEIVNGKGQVMAVDYWLFREILNEAARALDRQGDAHRSRTARAIEDHLVVVF